MKKLLPIFLILIFNYSYANTKQLNLKPFSTIVITGPVYVNVNNGSNYHLTAEANSAEILDDLKIYNSQRTLKVISRNPMTLNLSTRSLQRVEVLGHQSVIMNLRGVEHFSLSKEGSGNLILNGEIALGSLNYFGSGNLTINHLRELVTLNYQGSGDLTLNGVSHLQCLNFNGSGHLSILWLDSCSLNVTARGEGLIELAGVATQLQADLHGGTNFDARYLRSQNVAVRTFDCARADVFALSHLYTFADGYSNIYYYHCPCYFYKEMQRAGSVLNMSNIPGAYTNFLN